jgi:hypothetical protein
MLRSSLFSAGAVLCLGASVFAQENFTNKLHKLTRPPRDAGTYHLSTGTWTRNTNQANAGTQVIVYNNTCNVRYFTSVTPGATWFDEGRVPSPSGPDQLWVPAAPGTSTIGTARGCATSYQIVGFQSAACYDHGFGGAGEDMTLTFLESYGFCDPVTATPVASFLITGIPGGTPLGNVNCWIFTIDLQGSPDFTFSMAADGDGTYVGTDDQNRFGWGFSFPTTTGVQLGSPLLAGDYHHATGCSGYDGTVFDLPCHPAGSLAPNFPANGAFAPPFSGFSEDGTGMDTFDAFRIDPGFFVGSPPQFASCFFFGGIPGNPLSSFWLELYAPARCGPCEPGTQYCAGDGVDMTVTALCPCGNFGGVGRGCLNSNSTLGGAKLTATGTTSPNTILFNVNGIPNNNLTTFLRGTANTAAGFVFGDGVRCISGTTIRFGQQTSGPGGGNANFEANASPATVAAGNTRFYQTQYRNPSAGFCPPALFNISSGYILVW